jgi:hypothetical protein
LIHANAFCKKNLFYIIKFQEKNNIYMSADAPQNLYAVSTSATPQSFKSDKENLAALYLPPALMLGKAPIGCSSIRDMQGVLSAGLSYAIAGQDCIDRTVTHDLFFQPAPTRPAPPPSPNPPGNLAAYMNAPYVTKQRTYATLGNFIPSPPACGRLTN